MPPPGYGAPPYPGWYLPPVRRKRSRSVVTILVAVAVVASLIVGGINLARGGLLSHSQSPQLGSFAGYIGYVLVDQISATWSVPRILGPSPGAAASTWIGVQGPGQQEFFQVGTTESYEAGTDFYEAFWSDPAQGYHAQIMMQVAAGDEIQAEITRVSGSWQASVDDLSSGQSESAPTSSGVFTNLQLAEWIQEDPSLPHRQHVPYPHIARTTMSQLRVNGAPPTSSELQPQVMVLPRGGRVYPGRILGDSFTTNEVAAS